MAPDHEFMEASKKVFSSDGAITLPQEVLRRYGLSENMPVCIVETRCGILLVPLTDEPMSESLKAELEEWQALGAESLEVFPARLTKRMQSSKVGVRRASRTSLQRKLEVIAIPAYPSQPALRIPPMEIGGAFQIQP